MVFFYGLEGISTGFYSVFFFSFQTKCHSIKNKAGVHRNNITQIRDVLISTSKFPEK